MKVKQTVAALCLAAIMATSVGAAAEARDYAPLQNEGTWSHGCGDNKAGDRIYSEFESKMNPYKSWAYAVNDKLNGRDVTVAYGAGKATSEIWQVDYRTWYQFLVGIPSLYHHEWWDMPGYKRK